LSRRAILTHSNCVKYPGYHPTFVDFKGAIEDTIAGLSTIRADQLVTLMTHHFQHFENISLWAA
jgi:hypothetical protein